MPSLHNLLSIIIEQGGSDLHIAEGQPPKMRKHGDVMPIRAEPMLRDETISMLREISSEQNWNIFEERDDLDFAYEMDRTSRFRCNYLKQANGYGAVFRLIPTKIASLEQLGVPPVVKDLVAREPQPREDAVRQPDAFLHMPIEADALGHPERRRLADVVQQRAGGQRHRGIAQLFEQQQRVRPHVAFRVEFRRLRDALHGRYLGQDVAQQSGLIQKL